MRSVLDARGLDALFWKPWFGLVAQPSRLHARIRAGFLCVLGMLSSLGCKSPAQPYGGEGLVKNARAIGARRGLKEA